MSSLTAPSSVSASLPEWLTAYYTWEASKHWHIFSQSLALKKFQCVKTLFWIVVNKKGSRSLTGHPNTHKRDKLCQIQKALFTCATDILWSWATKFVNGFVKICERFALCLWWSQGEKLDCVHTCSIWLENFQCFGEFCACVYTLESFSQENTFFHHYLCIFVIFKDNIT